jgi:hypothetical protein
VLPDNLQRIPRPRRMEKAVSPSRYNLQKEKSNMPFIIHHIVYIHIRGFKRKVGQKVTNVGFGSKGVTASTCRYSKGSDSCEPAHTVRSRLRERRDHTPRVWGLGAIGPTTKSSSGLTQNFRLLSTGNLFA